MRSPNDGVLSALDTILFRYTTAWSDAVPHLITVLSTEGDKSVTADKFLVVTTLPEVLEVRYTCLDSPSTIQFVV